MKKNNPRKPFFNDEKKDSDSPKSYKKSDSFAPRSGGKSGDFDSKRKSFGKKDDSFGKPSFEKKFEGKPAFGDKPKGKFSKGEDSKSERPSYGKRFDSGEGKKPYGEKRFSKDGDSRGERPAFGKRFDADKEGKKPFGDKKYSKDDGFEKKYERREETGAPKRFFGDKPDSDRKKDFGPKKFEKRGEDTGKPFRKEFPDDQSAREAGLRKVYKGRGKDQNPLYAYEKPKAEEENKSEKRGFGKNRIARREINQDRPDYNFDNLPAKKSKGKEGEDLIRLNKYIANSGICSRREADDLIAQGLVTVNGEVVKEMGYKVKKTDRVVYQGKRINPEKPVYVLLNKPKDFITTTEDPMERKTVMKLVENACEERIFPVGRLDRNTTGLLLFTNDGELAAKLSHPSNEIKKIYQVTLDKPLTQKDEEQILEGLTLEDGEVKVDDMQVLSKDRTILGLEIHIGRNRIVRRLFAHFGYEVVALDRVMYAGLDKKDLKRGHYRFLTEQEVIRLKYYV